jgi:ubiquinone/menaquinone biosynthesis C-methylase UbiE
MSRPIQLSENVGTNVRIPAGIHQREFHEGFCLSMKDRGDSDDWGPVRRRERDFHDAVARGLSERELPPRPPDELERAILDRSGPLRGLRVLEAGCGAGDLTIELARRGAAVTALDLSSEMVGLARRRVANFAPGAAAEFVVAPLEQTGLPSEAFDLAVGKWVLHHAETAAVAEEIRRVLRPGGRGIFAENSGRNPILRLARAYLAGRWGIPKFGTDDEHPLVKADLQLYRTAFARVSLEYPNFNFLRLFDRQVLRYRWPAATRALAGFDALLYRKVKFLNRYSYNVILLLDRQGL